jgi:hypothetical protein
MNILPLQSLRHDQLTKVLQDLVKHIKNNTNTKYNKDIASRIGISSSELSKAQNYLNNEITKNRCLHIIEEIIKAYKIHVSSNGENYSFERAEDPTLFQLAGKLALNLVDVSTEFSEGAAPHEKIIAEKSIVGHNRRRERFIAIIGPGASYEASKGVIPLAEEGAIQIRRRIEDKEPALDKLIKEELDRLRHVYRLDPNDFETQLLAYSRFGLNIVLEGLEASYGLRYMPSLVYDILAHAFKHRFVDVIVNYNYDEILDNSIEEEIASGDYVRIFSDGDCPDKYEDLLTGNRLKHPVYIKPHGTISYKSSLRYTRKDYFNIPNKIRETIFNLIEAKVPNSDFERRLKPNILIIGLRDQPFELTEIILDYFRRYPDEEIVFWVFDNKQPHYENLFQYLNEEQVDKIKRNAHFFDLNDFTLEEYLLKLWDLTLKQFKEEYRPRGVENHLFVNHIFQLNKEKILDLKNSEKKKIAYFKERTYVEVIIALLQSDGILNAKQLVEDRAGKYFSLYKNAVKDEDFTLRMVCENLGMKAYKGIAQDTFVPQNYERFFKEDGSNLGRDMYDRLRQHQRSIGLPSPNASPERLERFVDLVKSLKKRNLLKITSDFQHPHNHLFEELRDEDILYTSLAWTYRYRKLMIDERDNWDLLLAISEEGRFLKKESFEGKKLGLILSSFDLDIISPVSEDEFPPDCLLFKKLLFLPWWLHNQHLVLFLKKARNHDGAHWKKNWTLQQGFYYQSHLLSRRVNPVHVTGENDKQTLLNIFANYWYRAKHYTLVNHGEVKTIPIISGKKVIEDSIAEIVRLYE